MKNIGKMDSFELNKIAAAILIALLIFKGADLISESLIHPVMLTQNAFPIEGVENIAPSPGAQAEKKGPSPIEPLIASANAQNGAIVFKKCTSCHTAEKGGPNKIGPDLYNVLGSPKGKHEGYTYSQAMEKKGGNWTYEDLNHFLYEPRQFVPGTKMSFAGLKNDQERADVIAYLRQQNDNPPPLPATKAELKEPSLPATKAEPKAPSLPKGTNTNRATPSAPVKGAKPGSNGTKTSPVASPAEPLPKHLHKETE